MNTFITCSQNLVADSTVLTW